MFEGKVLDVYMEGRESHHDIAEGTIAGEMHLMTGQEPVAAGLCAHLRKEDTLTGAHRAHHFALGKGMSIRAIAAEIMMKRTGDCKGKGGTSSV